MTRQQAQSEYEKKWAQAFLDYINSENGSDYETADHDNKQTPEWADVDVEAVSPSHSHPKLYLQLTTDSRLHTVFTNGKHRTPVFSSDNILQAISEKAEKYSKRGKDFSQITLLIQGTLTESSIPFEITDSLLNECKKYPFKKIYYLSAPSITNSGGVNHVEGWFFSELK